MVEVKKLKEKDIPQMIDLYAEFLRDQYGRNKYYKGDYKFKRMPEYYKKIINSRDDAVFVGEENNNVVGFMAISKKNPGVFFEFDYYAYLYDGFIKEDYRTSRLSLYLLEACEKWAKEKNLKYIAAYTYAFNKKVQKCFQFKKMEPYKITYIKKMN